MPQHHGRPIFQQDPLQVGLFAGKRKTSRTVSFFEAVLKPGVADAVRCGFAQERTVRGQNRDPCEPKRLHLLVQALRIGKIERKGPVPADAPLPLRGGRFGITTVSLYFSKLVDCDLTKSKSLAKTFLCCTQLPANRRENDADHKKARR